MTLQEFINRTSLVSGNYMDKEVAIVASNGMLYKPTIRYAKIDPLAEISPENTSYVVITME